jgi:hypothetical protein
LSVPGGPLSSNVAALTLILGAALLAAWVDLRFPQLSPGSFTGVGLHMLCSLFAVELGMRVLGAAAHAPVPVMAALFGAALPATMYMIITTFWLLRLLYGLLGRAVR